MSTTSSENGPPRPPLPVRARLQHVTVVIPPEGAEEARAFYGDVLGLEEGEVLPALDPQGFIWYRVGEELELHLMLADEPPPERPHFCLELDELDALQHRLEQASVATHVGTRIVGRRRFTCRDPFGNLIEFMTREI